MEDLGRHIQSGQRILPQAHKQPLPDTLGSGSIIN